MKRLRMPSLCGMLLLLCGCLGIHAASGQEQGKPETWKIALTAGFDEAERAPSMDIVRQIQNILQEMKFQVKFLNESDLTRAQCQKSCKDWGANLSVASGFNSSSNDKAHGLTLYVHPEKAGSGSEKLADKTLREIANIPIHKHEQRNCGVRKVGFPLCDCEKMGGDASILVKYAFHTNPDEAHKYVNSPDAQREYAIAVAKAICDYTGVKYTGLEAVKPEEPKPEPPKPEPSQTAGGFPDKPTRRYDVNADMVPCHGMCRMKAPFTIYEMDGTPAHKDYPTDQTYEVGYKTKDGLWFYQTRNHWLMSADPKRSSFEPR